MNSRQMGLGMNDAVNKNLDAIVDAEEEGLFEVEVGKDIMTAGMYFDKEDLWQERGYLRAFHVFLSVICIGCQALLSWVVFDQYLFFEFGMSKRLHQIEESTYANYRRIYCFSEIKENYEYFDDTL